MTAQMQELTDEAFEVTAAPYLIVDRDLCIIAVNAAYEAATAHPRSDLLGEQIFDAFPDNPADPCADGVARLTDSFESVLRTGKRHRMALQRYDVRDPSEPSTFRYKMWAPVNSPIRDGRGTTIAVLHHVEDLTELLPREAERTGSAEDQQEKGSDSRARLLYALRHERDVAAHLHTQVETLGEALATNRQISVAVGLVAAECALSQDAAFKWLVAKSQRAHRKLRDIAVDVVREHERNTVE